jgi:excisionase family DNA binding protein
VTRYLLTEDVARRYGVSVRTVHSWTRRGLIPHRKIVGVRRCLFLEAELEAWDNGDRVVRPKAKASLWAP